MPGAILRGDTVGHVVPTPRHDGAHRAALDGADPGSHRRRQRVQVLVAGRVERGGDDLIRGGRRGANVRGRGRRRGRGAGASLSMGPSPDMSQATRTPRASAMGSATSCVTVRVFRLNAVEKYDGAFLLRMASWLAFTRGRPSPHGAARQRWSSCPVHLGSWWFSCEDARLVSCHLIPSEEVL